jgi:hypothetical protein
MGSISLGMALVAGKNLVPRPATGKTAFLIGFMGLIIRLLAVKGKPHNGYAANISPHSERLAPAFLSFTRLIVG